MRKFIAYLLFVLLTSITFSESYKIGTVKYDITGKTREYSLSQEVPIDQNKIFPTLESLENYISNLEQQLVNQRVLASATIVSEFSEPDENGLIYVSLLITTIDTWNFIAVPYPKYDSNSGLSLSIKLKNYNFLGSMRTFSSDLVYKQVEDDNDENAPLRHRFSFSFGFDIPFQLSVFNSSWTNDFDFSYTIGDKYPGFSIYEGLSFSLPLKIAALNFGIKQGFNLNPSYESAGDIFYLRDEANISLPVTLAKIQNFGNITWTPSISMVYNWDLDAFKGNSNGGITHTDLLGPSLSFSHGISISRINWINNYKNGFSASFNQSYSYNFYTKSANPSFSFNSQFHKAFKYVGLSTKQYWFININGNTQDFGDNLRGIRNSYGTTDTGITFNFDFKFKVWQTDWVGLGNKMGLNWTWPAWLDFEMQLNPFIDIGLNHNLTTNSYFGLRDGYYGCGLEIIGFPNKMRSIQGRISFGVDAVRFADKYLASRSGFVNKVVNKFFNTDWRTGSWYEIFIGIGLFY